MKLFDSFYEGSLDVERLNYGVITLLPKISDANKIQQFRPICLLRCIYKLITKTLTLRLEPYASMLISEQQNAFIKNRSIMDGICSLHEIMHHVHIKKQVRIILKLDFEKAYDKVNWDFLLNLHNGTVSVKINNEVGKYFQSAKGVRQGDPLSPFLFNMAGEVLTKMVLSAQRNGLFSGLASDLVENGIAILQYADDTVLCIEHDQEKTVNSKLLLYIFEMMSGLKINFLKSEVFIVGGDNNIASFYSDLFNCQVGSLPMKYLGVPVTFSNLKNVDWDFLDAKIIKKLDNWVCDSTTSGGRLTLLDACLSGIPYYYMSMFLLSLTFIEKLNKHRRGFFWAGKKRKRNII